jgi:hypothetical protein
MKVLFITLMVCFGAFARARVNNHLIDARAASSASTGYVLNQRGTFETLPQGLAQGELNDLLFSELQEQNSDLKRVKYYLINGETGLAQVHLTKLSYTQTKLKPIINRYLGILNFIEGKFQKSLDHLNLKELQNGLHYPQICTLKVLNMVVLNKINSLEKEWEKCQLNNFNHFNSGNFIWLQTLIQMKLYPRVGLTKVPFKGIKLISMSKDDLKIFLKLALYLNQEKLIENQLSDLDVSQLEEPEVRELVGQILFRLGHLAKSFRYVEDLTSPNSENIKGNLYVLRKKYELAYAQFKLALEKKQNSQNAMERILPLAWLLGDWEEGAKITQRVIASPQTQINKMTLVAAFFAQKGDYPSAKAVIDTVISKSRKGLELDVTQLHSFVGLMQNETQVVKKQASLSCAQFDLINCWLGLQMEQWDSYPLTIRRPDKVQIKKEWEKLTQEEINEPLQETVYINQIDIEELDDKLIKLIPNSPK